MQTKKIIDASALVRKTYNTKTTEIDGKILRISGLAPATALTAVENKISSVGNLVKNKNKKKTDYNTKINEIEKKLTDHDHDKYIATPKFNKLAVENFAARLAQANLVTKSDIANFVYKTDFDNKLKNLSNKVTSYKSKHLLVENEFKKKKLQTFDLSLFISQSYFNNDESQLF